MRTNVIYSGFTLEEARQLQAIEEQLEVIRSRDSRLADLIQQRDSLEPVLQHLESNTDTEALLREAAEETRVWHDVGLFFMHAGRTHDAIAFFQGFYERLCECEAAQMRWLPKGLPLVRISECHERLGHPCLSARYLLLTAVSDAVRDNGVVQSNGGVLFRALGRGWTTEQIQRFYSRCFEVFDPNDCLSRFPEHILSMVQLPFTMPYASASELDIYRINKVYADELLKRMNVDSTRIDGKDLEKLAWYFLSSIPGFEVRADLGAADTQYDGLIRNLGPKYDFRADLGFYVLVECKQWSGPVGVSEVSQFINKLVLQDCRGGILFSSQGITGTGEKRYAELQVLKAHYRAGKVILVLNVQDFQEVSKGGNLITMLRQKYEDLRFDVKSSTRT